MGRTALSAALDYFEAQGMMYSQIETLASNERGQRLYSRFGYREVARKIHYFTCLADRQQRQDSRPACREIGQCSSEGR